MAVANERGGVSYIPTPEEELAAQQAANYQAGNVYSTGTAPVNDYAWGNSSAGYPPPQGSGYMPWEQTVDYYAGSPNTGSTYNNFPPPPPPKSDRSTGIGGWVQGVSDAAAVGLQQGSDALFALFDSASRVFNNASPSQGNGLPSPGLGLGGPLPLTPQKVPTDASWDPSAGGGSGGFDGPDQPSWFGPPGPVMPRNPSPSGIDQQANMQIDPNGPPGTGGLPGGPVRPIAFPPDETSRKYPPGIPPAPALIPGFVPIPPFPVPVPVPIPPGGVPIVPIRPTGPEGAGGLPGGPTRMIDIIPALPPIPAPASPVGPPGPIMPRNPSPTPQPPPQSAPPPMAGAPAPAPVPAAPAPTQGMPLITPTGEVYGTLETKPDGSTVVKRLPKNKPNRWNIPQLPTTDPRQMLIDMGIANQALPPGITQRVPPGFALPPGFLMPRWAEQNPLPPTLFERLQPGAPNRGQDNRQPAGRSGRDRRNGR